MKSFRFFLPFLIIVVFRRYSNHEITWVYWVFVGVVFILVYGNIYLSLRRSFSREIALDIFIFILSIVGYLGYLAFFMLLK